MKIFENPNVDTGFKLLAVALIFLGLRRLFSQSDGKRGFSLMDFQKLTAYGLFVWAFVYILVAERNRTEGTPHIFDSIWLAFIITGLFTVLHMDHILDKMGKLLELLIQLRSKVGTTTTTEVSQKTTATVKETKEPAPIKEEIN